MPKFTIRVRQTLKSYQVGYHELEADDAEAALEAAAEMDDPADMKEQSSSLEDVNYELAGQVHA